MARIQTYQNDATVTLDDKVIGTDAVDNSTKNFTVGDILALGTGVTYTAGTGIDITDNVITCTVTDTNTDAQTLSINGSELTISNGNTITLPAQTSAEEKLVLKIIGDTITTGTETNVLSAAVTGNILTGSLHTNPNTLASSGNPIMIIEALVDVTVRLSIGSFVNSLANNSRISFSLYGDDGSGAALMGTAIFDHSRTGNYADSFFSYFKLRAGTGYYFTATAVDADIEVLDGSIIEFYVVD